MKEIWLGGICVSFLPPLGFPRDLLAPRSTLLRPIPARKH